MGELSDPARLGSSGAHFCLSGCLCLPSVQNQVDEVIDVMQENITKVIERGERLDDLQDKSGVMANTALLGQLNLLQF